MNRIDSEDELDLWTSMDHRTPTAYSNRENTSATTKRHYDENVLHNTDDGNEDDNDDDNENCFQDDENVPAQYEVVWVNKAKSSVLFVDGRNGKTLLSTRIVTMNRQQQQQRRRKILVMVVFVLSLLMLLFAGVLLRETQKKKNREIASAAASASDRSPLEYDIEGTGKNITKSDTIGSSTPLDQDDNTNASTEESSLVDNGNPSLLGPDDGSSTLETVATTMVPPPYPTTSTTAATTTTTTNNNNAPSSVRETVFPTFSPTSMQPTATPTTTTTSAPTTVTFDPGELTVRQNGLLLSTGLTSRLLATSGRPVVYDTPSDANGQQQSRQVFHSLPDMGACFVDPRNPGGWIYVSNSEVRTAGRGGVGALTFDADGQLVDYQRILTGTTSNCGGGRTPWGAWISCEETTGGQAWQVDPTGGRAPEVITLGSDGGVFESFAYDDRNPDDPVFFLTEDIQQGALQRFRVDSSPPDWNDPWNILLGPGTTDFLVLNPNGSGTGGTFEWTLNRQRARRSAAIYYPNSEGIDVHDGQLYFVSKVYQEMYTLDLDARTYTVESTDRGLFNGGPDQIKRILNHDDNGTTLPSNYDDLLFFTEDGGIRAGIHARNAAGAYLTILESDVYENETTGLSFSPDGKAMYIAYQNDGLLFEIRREDGLPFYGNSLNVAYHATA
eukprot:scaffold5220_cov188-Amphora_coffeaeformis.AAC.2